jgi:hypothetical protein
MKRSALLAVTLLLGTGCGSSSSGGGGTDGGGEDASMTTHPDATTPGLDSSSGDDAGDAADVLPSDLDAAGAASANATSYIVTNVELQGACAGSACLCLPQPLPVDGAGNPPCQVFVELAAADGGLDAGTDAGTEAGPDGARDGGADAGDDAGIAAPQGPCEALGLAEASPDVIQSIFAARHGTQTGPVCVLPQVPSAEWVNGSCGAASEAGAGWCYGTGAAAGSCQQVLLATPTGLPPAGSLVLLGCGDTAPDAGAQGVDATSVGTACIPSQERVATFGGFNQREVTLDENNAACPGAVCLVNHFQGLTTCPYGQDTQARPANGGAAACSVPGTGEPVRPGAAVGGQTVQPWCTDRLPTTTVACSCRCQNVQGRTDDGASYCACPSGFTCSQVVPEIESGDPRAGGYCVAAGTAYDPTSTCHATCDAPVTPCP